MPNKKPFDVLCDLVEQFPDSVVRKLLEDARIFEIERNTFTKDQLDDASTDFDAEFRLPYPTVAVEIGPFLFIISDLLDGQSGFKEKRAITTLYSIKGTDGQNVVDTVPIIGTGFFKSSDNGKSFDLFLSYTVIILGKIFQMPSDEMDTFWEKRVTQTPGREKWSTFHFDGICLALQCLNILISDTRNFVVETSPVASPKQPLKPGRLRRTHQRPSYTLLRPKAARRIMGLPDPDKQKGSHATPIAHERKGHYRHFRSEYYVNLQGYRKWINHTWVGPSESIVGNKRYKVVLDEPGVSMNHIEVVESDNRTPEQRMNDRFDRRERANAKKKAKWRKAKAERLKAFRQEVRGTWGRTYGSSAEPKGSP